MKTILLLLAFTLGFTLNLNAQTEQLKQDETWGSDCTTGIAIQKTIEGNLLLKKHTLTLKNIMVEVKGNLIGDGVIIKFAENCGVSLCVRGKIVGNVNLNGITCFDDFLNNQEFEFKPENYGLNYKVYDMLGREIQKGVTSESLFHELPKNKLIILKVEKFVANKMFLK